MALRNINRMFLTESLGDLWLSWGCGSNNLDFRGLYHVNKIYIFLNTSSEQISCRSLNGLKTGYVTSVAGLQFSMNTNVFTHFNFSATFLVAKRFLCSLEVYSSMTGYSLKKLSNIFYTRVNVLHSVPRIYVYFCNNAPSFLIFVEDGCRSGILP